MKRSVLILFFVILPLGGFVFLFHQSAEKSAAGIYEAPPIVIPLPKDVVTETREIVTPPSTTKKDPIMTEESTIPVTPDESIQKALDRAQPGDTIVLSDGLYREDIVSRRNGTRELPITIRGSRNAIIKGGGGRVIEVNHDYLVLDGFTVDGHWNDKEEAASYRDKLIYVQGKEKKSGVTGLLIRNMEIRNAGGECVRLRYFAEKNEIAHNTISRCGVRDFSFNGSGKNGEGIYIGTAPEQLKDGKNPTTDEDQSNGNWIHDNVIDTQGNECVDIKEGSTGNIVEKNRCTGQKDKESAGMDSRGNGNIFRHNEISGNLGAGVRLGGDDKRFGIGNLVYGNIIRGNRSGGIKLMRFPQERICGNTFSDNAAGIFVGRYASKMSEDACPR